MFSKKYFNKIVFIRHGESLANLENRFTGWLDVDLTKKGYEEAYYIGLKLKNMNFKFDICYTSNLKRAIRTTWGILDGLNTLYTPIKSNIYLNERHYGIIGGLNINEAIKKFGKKKILSWLNFYNESPPKIKKKDIRYIYDKTKYKNYKKIPKTETLKNTLKRILKLWNNDIKNKFLKKKKILIVSHSNILKTLMKYLDKTKEKKMTLIKNTTPIIYEFNKNFEKIKNYTI